MGTSLMVQWLRLRSSNAEGVGSIPGQGTKTPHTVQHSQKLNLWKNNITLEDFHTDQREASTNIRNEKGNTITDA